MEWRFHKYSMLSLVRRIGEIMSESNKMKSTKNKKKEDGTFHSKKVKHDPQAESARAVFGWEQGEPSYSNKYNTDR